MLYEWNQIWPMNSLYDSIINTGRINKEMCSFIHFSSLKKNNTIGLTSEFSQYISYDLSNRVMTSVGINNLLVANRFLYNYNSSPWQLQSKILQDSTIHKFHQFMTEVWTRSTVSLSNLTWVVSIRGKIFLASLYVSKIRLKS